VIFSPQRHEDTKRIGQREGPAQNAGLLDLSMSGGSGLNTFIHLSVLRVFVVKNLSDDGSDTQRPAATAANLHRHGNHKETFGRQGTHVAQVLERGNVFRE